MTRSHVPVLAGELIDLTHPREGDTVVDCTFGAGGHARLMADRIGPSGTLVCVDRDPAAEEHFDELAAEVACETRFLRMDYAEALELLVEEGLRADLVYLDLGVSSMQVDARERGFSYSYDAPLDMRMDPSQDLDAREILNGWDERRLAQLFRRLGEDPNARIIAREIVRRRAQAPLTTTGDLVDAIESALPAAVRRRFGGSSPAKRVFQAVRIAVNSELESLDRALPAAWAVLRPGGRLAAISFHSLEDRPVKRFLVDRARGCICPPDLPVCACGQTPEAELLTRRSVVPTAGEMADNSRSRSARLRAARKLTEGERV
jgi:16S rRNA (cytosine1402-N4)-methyltransferase